MLRSRAEQAVGAVEADVVTARAVSALVAARHHPANSARHR